MTSQRTDERGLYGSALSDERRRERFATGEVPVAVYGLGKMGLPVAAVYAETTGNVTGVDVDETVVERVNRGECPVENEPLLPELVSETAETGALRATAESRSAAEAASVHVVIVPTLITEDDEPDLSVLETAVRDVGGGLDPGDAVFVESTVPPGTCRDVVAPLLEAESGLDVGEFGLAFCPERTSSGRAVRDVRGAYPKVVGGVDAESTRVAELVYDELTDNDVLPVSDATTAECVKVFEGVYRDVNIALANELAGLSDDLGIDVREAIDVANTQPFCDIHDPGAGVGGHCIPYYPYFLIREFDREFPLLSTARSVNREMPAVAVAKLLDGLEATGTDPEDATVAVLGVAYRPGIPETRASPAYPIIDGLADAGVTPVAVDPVVDDPGGEDAPSSTLADLPEHDLNGAVLVTAHEEFDRIDWTAFEDLVIVDGRDALALAHTDHDVYTIGRGTHD